MQGFACLTWIPGIIILLFFFCSTFFTSYLVSVLSTAADGTRLRTYDQMAANVIGSKRAKLFVMPFIYSGVVGVTIAYLIAVGESSNSLYTSHCTNCPPVRQLVWTSVGAVVQLGLSFFPNLEKLQFVSLLGAVMSFGYSLITIVLKYVVQCRVYYSGFLHIRLFRYMPLVHILIYLSAFCSNGVIYCSFTMYGRLSPVSYDLQGSTTDKVFDVFMGIVMICFSYNYSIIVPDVQVTKKIHPKQKPSLTYLVYVSMIIN